MFTAFMPDLVHFLLMSLTAVKAVGAVEHPPGDVADVLVGVNHARGDNYHLTVGVAGHQRLFVVQRGRNGAGVPEVYLEIARPDEGETVGLITMLVRTAGNAGERLADVAHHRMVDRWKLVFPVQLDQPAATVFESLQRLDHHTVDQSFFKHDGSGGLPCVFNACTSPGLASRSNGYCP